MYKRQPKHIGPKGATPKHIIIKMPKVKDKERILKAARKKQLVTYEHAPIALSTERLLVKMEV